MANQTIGTCACPICAASGAEVREDIKRRAYIHCDACVTLIRSQSRQGTQAMRALAASAPDHKVGAGGTAAAVSPAPTPKPAAKPAPATMGIFGL